MLGNLGRTVLQGATGLPSRGVYRFASTQQQASSSLWRQALPVALAVTGGAAALSLGSVEASGADNIPPPTNRPEMLGKILSYDAASLRRGYQVYKEVCATCHSLDGIRYGMMVNTILLEEEAKAEAAENEYPDEPDEEGEVGTRPGKLMDPFPAPYPNEEAARFANNGALPPPLTLIVGARHGGSHYLFSLLTGYCDAPAGVEMAEGMHYNPYFHGGQIGMPPPLSEDMLEYDDGTQASVSQMAKDVAHFLEWSMNPRFDENKHMEVQKAVVMFTLIGLSWLINKQKWAVPKTRQIKRFF
uniref:Cytochrome c domain-containing protein n=1 Tax=Paramoeba aestuarina TaxID=180227 RepID=A0A7S4PHL5_9EUKA|mmetsp:Transcript_5804/g.8776  ORF Transcript_5804/g.8776 Transcript_5804/m.8776 type:complete len:301 (+) Transcript_5804:66-968(+)